MRIAVVCSDLGVRVPGDKGASMHLTAISQAFAALGHEVLLCGVAGHGPAPEGVRSLLLAHPGRSTGVERERRKLAFTEHLVEVAGPVLDDFAPDLVYERLALFGTAGLRLARRTGARHVLEINALLTREEATWRGLHHTELAARREHEALVAADLRVAVSHEWAEEVRALVGRHPTVTVPNGVAADAFRALPRRAAARAAFGLPAGTMLAGFVGALRGWHGLDVAIDALAETAQPVDLVVAGDGDLRAELTARAQARGVADRVHWLGHVAHDRVPTLLAGLDLALAPYPSREGFAFSPLKLYEYLAAGVPVVASDVGQVRSVLAEARAGLLVEPGDVAGLAQAIDLAVLDWSHQRGRAALARRWTLAEHSWERRAAAILAAGMEVGGHALAR